MARRTFTTIEPVSDEEIFRRVTDVLVDALGVDHDEVEPRSRLGPDLGAESIDYLDISFRIEKAFPGLCIQGRTTSLIGVDWGSAVNGDGCLLENAHEILKRRYPEFDWPEGMAGKWANDFIKDFYTVERMCHFIRCRIDHPELNQIN